MSSTRTMFCERCRALRWIEDWRETCDGALSIVLGPCGHVTLRSARLEWSVPRGWCLALLVALAGVVLSLPGVGPGVATAASRPDAPRPALVRRADRRAEIASILAVLDQTAADPAIRVKAAQKLVTLGDEQLRVMTSLSRRVAVEGGRPADGLALFLIIAMLILS